MPGTEFETDDEDAGVGTGVDGVGFFAFVSFGVTIGGCGVRVSDCDTAAKGVISNIFVRRY